MLNKDIQKVVEFMIEYKPEPKYKLLNNSLLISSGPATGGNPIQFTLTPDSLQNIRDVSIILN